tara:strand:- start:4451 stop:4705 length:255 start_codon:yes stop_codon:yes gene_type:complete
MRKFSVDETGIFISKITDKHIWVVYVHEGKPIFEQPIAQTFRDHLEESYNLDVKSGEVAKGFQPETAFAKVKLLNRIEDEVKIA